MGLTEYTSLETVEKFPMSGCITDSELLYEFQLLLYSRTVDFAPRVMWSGRFYFWFSVQPRFDAAYKAYLVS